MTIKATTAMAKRIDGHRNILGVPVFGGSRRQVLAEGSGWLAGGGGKSLAVVVTVTTEQVVLAQHNPAYCSSLMQSTLNVADTVGIRWAMGLNEHFPGVELAEMWVREALEHGQKVFLLGGVEGVAEGAAEKLKTQNSKLKIITQNEKLNALIAWDEGAEEIGRETVEEREKVLNRIKDFRPALVLVAYGAPWQERWIMENAGALKEAGVRLAMGVGGAFDMWAGKVPRAPLQWRKLGLEWLWRLLHEPWRIKRQLRLVEFVFRVGAERNRRVLVNILGV